MAASRSFTDYVASRLYNDLYKQLKNISRSIPKSLDLIMQNVRRQGKISLADLEIKLVRLGKSFLTFSLKQGVIIARM